MKYYKFGDVIVSITKEKEERILQEKLKVEKATFKEYFLQELIFNVKSFRIIRKLL